MEFDNPDTRRKVYAAYRSYFDIAEKKRRWNIRTDIPWDQCNNGIDPAIADIVQTFCMVELYLPDYLSEQLPMVRENRGRAWMLANWGYEESKHSMVLEDWLVRSGHRTERQIEAISDTTLANEWKTFYGEPLAGLVYTMFQEVATKLHYRNLRKIANGRCPALDRVLELITTDEAAHGHFFKTLVGIYLEDNREATLEAIRHVSSTFNMPAVHLMAESRRRAEVIRSLEIFDERVFHTEVYTPLIQQLGLTRQDLRVKR